MNKLLVLLLVLLAYLSGSVPYGLLIGRLRGVDVRQVGSGNIGATNVGRALGPLWAVLVLLLDAAKGYGPVWLASRLLTHDPGRWGCGLCMLAAVAGHIFPCWLRFRGGKGVATGLGVALAVDPLAAGVGLAVYGFTYALLRVSALGSLCGLAVVLVSVTLRQQPMSVILALASIALLVVLRHRENLRQLRRRLTRRR